MLRVLIKVLFFLIACQWLQLSWAQPRETRMWVDGQLRASSVSDRGLRSQVSGLEAAIGVEHRLVEDLVFDFLGDARLEAGSTTAVVGNEYEPKNQLRVDSARVEYRGLKPFAFSGGVLDQSQFGNTLLFRSRGFPGVSERFSSGNTTRVTVIAEQAISTGTEVLPYPTGSSEVPTLFYERATLQHQVNSWLQAEAHVDHFLFQGLGTGVAHESRFLGNTVTGLGSQNARYRYEFHGWGSGGKLRADWSSKISTEVGSSFINNWNAPVGKNQAWNAFVRVPWTISREWVASPQLTFFHAESDSSPALYSSREWGFKNREGFRGDLEVTLPNRGIYLRAGFTQAGAIQKSFAQSDYQEIEVGVGKVYEFF